MFIKVTRSGPRRYVQFVEAYRDDAGQPRQRTVATLGRLDQMGSELESVISGLMRVTGKSPPEAALPPAPAPDVAFEAARDYGDVWTLSELWNSLGFDRLRKVFAQTRHTINVPIHQEALLGSAFWARGYFCATVGQMTQEMIKQYLEHHFEPNPNDEFQTKSP